MKKDIAKKWIEELQSGKYRKHNGMLRYGSTRNMCCLGVLCDLYRKEVGGRWRKGMFYAGTHEGGDDSLGDLPSIRRWAGMTIQTNGQLAMLNDNTKDWDDVIYRIRRLAKLRKDEI